MQALKRWRARRAGPIDEGVWQAVSAGLTPLLHLDADDRQRLRALLEQFLAHKTFVAKGDVDAADPTLRALIGLQACLPILNLGLDCYRDWRTVIVYPHGFGAERDAVDDAGVVHSVVEPLAGEAWERGPLIVSWHDVLSRGEGFNVVVHECAHKLDMRNGAVNGFPPLHNDMDARLWSRVWSAAYDDLCCRVDADEDTALDPYAAEAPGEFFAVASETFFELPQLLLAEYPAVYRQLRQFYRQDPAARRRW